MQFDISFVSNKARRLERERESRLKWIENRWIRNNFGCAIQDESVGKMVLIWYYTRIKLEASVVKLIILASSKFPSLSIKVLISETNKVSLCLPWAIDKLQTNEKIVKQKRNVIFLISNFDRFFSKWCEIFWCQTNKMTAAKSKPNTPSTDWLAPKVRLFNYPDFIWSWHCS